MLYYVPGFFHSILCPIFCFVKMYTSVFTHLTVNGYLVSFQFEATLVGVITLKRKEKELHLHRRQLSLYLGVKLLGHTLCIF